LTYTDPFLDDDPGQQNQNTVTLPRDQIRAMERDAKTAREAAARADAAERKLAIVTAGIDATNPLGRFFAENYKGELTAEAIKSAYDAITSNDSNEDPPPPPPATDPAASTPPPSTDFRQQLANGSQSDDGLAGQPPKKPVRQEAVEIGRNLLKEGVTDEEAMGATFRHLVGGAIAGDPTVIRPGF